MAESDIAVPTLKFITGSNHSKAVRADKQSFEDQGACWHNPVYTFIVCVFC